MGRILAIDYGNKRIGLAVTDPMQIFATPLNTIKTDEFDIFLEEYLKKETIDRFVIGYPVQMNNEPSQSIIQINPFIKKLKKNYPKIDIFLIDERFTSKMALETIIAGGVKKKNRQDKAMIDKISAAIILKSYLDKRENKTKS
jgi:putative holliday junction resolvase